MKKNSDITKYSEFKKLLEVFIRQAEVNVKYGVDKTNRLSDAEFSKGEVVRHRDSDAIQIDSNVFYCHLFNTGSYGPRSGNGSSQVPYINFDLKNGIWGNLRFTFSDFTVISIRAVIWVPENIDYPTNLNSKITDLGLFDNELPNAKLISFYDDYIHLANTEEYKQVLQNRGTNQSQLSIKLLNSYNLILRGAPGTGKTYLAKQIARELTDDNEEQIGFVQFHPSYDYTDFVEGLRPVKDDSGEIRFDIRPGIFKMFCKKAQENTDKKFVFIIDEINRGEISKIFGELFYSIDPGYRGEDGAVSTQYANMHQEEEKFYIPENVYIIGTMNDIDRSVDSFDFAMRRRFRFVEIKAADSMVMWEKDENFDNDQIPEARTRLTNLNQAIENTPELNSNYHIGPSYFLKLPELDYDYEILWQDYLQPLLEEYLRGTFEEAERLSELKAAYDRLEEETHVDEG